MGEWVRLATEAAVYQFGSRHYKGWIAARVVFKILPWMLVSGAVGALAFATWRWALPGVGAAARWSPNLLPALVIAVGLGVVLVGAMWLRWRFGRLRVPYWLRDISLADAWWWLQDRGVTGKHMALIGVVLLGVTSGLIWL